MQNLQIKNIDVNKMDYKLTNTKENPNLFTSLEYGSFPSCVGKYDEKVNLYKRNNPVQQLECCNNTCNDFYDVTGSDNLLYESNIPKCKNNCQEYFNKVYVDNSPINYCIQDICKLDIDPNITPLYTPMSYLAAEQRKSKNTCLNNKEGELMDCVKKRCNSLRCINDNKVLYNYLKKDIEGNVLIENFKESYSKQNKKSPMLGILIAVVVLLSVTLIISIIVIFRKKLIFKS